jgi:hypothetical protein
LFSKCSRSFLRCLVWPSCNMHCIQHAPCNISVYDDKVLVRHILTHTVAWHDAHHSRIAAATRPCLSRTRCTPCCCKLLRWQVLRIKGVVILTNEYVYRKGDAGSRCGCAARCRPAPVRIFDRIGSDLNGPDRQPPSVLRSSPPVCSWAMVCRVLYRVGCTLQSWCVICYMLAAAATSANQLQRTQCVYSAAERDRIRCGRGTLVVTGFGAGCTLLAMARCS